MQSMEQRPGASTFMVAGAEVVAEKAVMVCGSQVEGAGKDPGMAVEHGISELVARAVVMEKCRDPEDAVMQAEESSESYESSHSDSESESTYTSS